MSPAAAFPCIVGVPRSGTTMLRLMIDAHPDIAIPPETGFMTLPLPAIRAMSALEYAIKIMECPPQMPAWKDFQISSDAFLEAVRKLAPAPDASDTLRLFYKMYANRFGKTRSGDKTPVHLHHMPTIARLLPEASFIHLVRDGRDVALSWQKTWFAPSHNPVELVKLWAHSIRSARAQSVGLKYMEVQYFDLITRPELTLQRICAFADLQFKPAMLDYHLRARTRLSEHQARYSSDGRLIIDRPARLAQQQSTESPPDQNKIGTWVGKMSSAELAACDLIAGELLANHDQQLATLV